MQTVAIQNEDQSLVPSTAVVSATELARRASRLNVLEALQYE
jgi:hypothetical protein